MTEISSSVNNLGNVLIRSDLNVPIINGVISDDYRIYKSLEILDKILKGETPKPGSYKGRINNEPINNRKTLMDLKNA